MLNQGTYLVVTPFFPSNESFVGSYVYDQINEIQNQSNFSIEIVKVVSYFSLDSDYEFNGFKVNIFKNFDFPYFIFPGLFHSCNKRRFSKDSQLSINQTIKKQFNHLRINDNKLYPSFFHYKGQKYIVKIFKEKIKFIF